VWPHATRFECIAERKLRGRQLTVDANVEISGRDLRQVPRPGIWPIIGNLLLAQQCRDRHIDRVLSIDRGG
jgi:hypothetical protein